MVFFSYVVTLWQGPTSTNGEYACTYIPVKNKINKVGITYVLFQKMSGDLSAPGTVPKTQHGQHI